MISREEKKRVVANFISLFILQIFNYLLPLLLLPFLARKLGIAGIGLLAYATAIVAFFRAVSAFGFDLAGAREISVNREDTLKVSSISTSILGAKLLIGLVTFLIFSLLIFAFPSLRKEWQIFYATYLIILGDILFPVWFFQGVERMKMIVYFRLGYKSIYTAIIFLVVNNADDVFLVPLLDGIGSIFVALWSLHYAKKEFNIIFLWPAMSDIRNQIENAKHIFISNISVIFYTSLNTILLGFLTNNTLVGYYSISEKIYSAIRGILNPIIQSVFPLISKKYEEDINSYYRLVKKLTYLFFLMLAMLASALFYLSPYLVELVAGQPISLSTEVLKVLAVSLIFAVGGLFSAFLVVKSEGRMLSKITSQSMFLNLFLIFPAILYYGVFGMAFTFLAVQAFQTVLQVKTNFEIFQGGASAK